MNRFRFSVLLVGICFALIFSGCRSSKGVGGEDSKQFKEQKEILAAVQEQSVDFRTMSARLRADVIMPDKEVSSRVDLKMIKDSLIQLSVQPFLGIEVFRLELTTDSIRLIDRMGKRYLAENYSAMKKQWTVDFDFYNLQALFINSIFVPGEKTFDPKQYNRFLMKKNTQTVEFVAEDRADIRYCFNVDKENKLLSSRISDASDKFVLTWDYSDFQVQGNKLFPMNGNVGVVVDGRNVGGLSLSYSRIQIDKDLKINTSVPSKYERVTAEQLLKMLKF